MNLMTNTDASPILRGSENDITFFSHFPPIYFNIEIRRMFFFYWVYPLALMWQKSNVFFQLLNNSIQSR